MRMRGFTLIELVAVLAILGVLLSLVLPKYTHGVDAAKESVLAENLRATRVALDHFYADRGRYPESLDELVERRYLRAVPVDPFVGGRGGWLLIGPPPGIEGRVADLKSRAPGKGRNGLPYGQW